MKKTIFLMLCIAFTTKFLSVKATIVYTDITDGQPATINMDNSGTAEFTIQNGAGTCVGDYITYITGCNIIASGTAASGWDEALGMAKNTPIGSTGNFIGQGDCEVTGWGGATTFPLNVDKYLGVKFLIGTNTHYGWIRVYVTGTANNYTVTYKDYAYESLANVSILAGENPTGINETILSNDNGFKFYNNQNQVKIVSEEANNTINTVELLNINGQLIKTINANNSKSVNVDIDNISKGVYFIMILTDNKKNIIHKMVK